MKSSERSVPVTEAAVQQFAAVTGDWNPVHFDDAAARRAGLPGRCAHGLWVAGLAAQEAAAAGLRVRRITARFERPALVGTTIHLRIEADLRWSAASDAGDRLAFGTIEAEP